MERKKKKGGLLYLTLFLTGFFLLGKSTFLGVSLIILSFILPPIMENAGKKGKPEGTDKKKNRPPTLPHHDVGKKKSSSALFYIVLIIFFIIFPPFALLLLFIKLLAWGSEKKKGSTTYTPAERSVVEEHLNKRIHKEKSHLTQDKGQTYTYSTSHTEKEIKTRRGQTFSGIIHLETADIGEAIGLIRITEKLAGIKKITIKATLTGDITILGIPSKNKVFRAKTSGGKKAITLIRKLYATNMLKNISLSIEIKNKNSQYIDTLREIAEETYKAVWKMGGEKDVLTV